MINKIRDWIAEKRIPKSTVYCYNEKKCCPYWKYRKGTKKEFEEIYVREILGRGFEDSREDFKKTTKGDYIYECKYLRYKDIYQGGSLLWDQCKECGINDDFEEEDDLNDKNNG